MPVRVLLGVLLFGAVLTIGIGAAVSQGDATTYSASQVRGAFDEAGLTVRLAGSAMGGAAFVENRDRFTVVVSRPSPLPRRRSPRTSEISTRGRLRHERPT